MHTDAYFAIGKTHDVCEDYAVAGQTDSNLCYAIVSDGCSSSPRTDLGARFLATAAEVQIRTHSTIPHGYVVAACADSARKVLGLPQTCLDATLVVATMDDKEIKVSMWGDGEVVIVRDDDFEWVTVEYAHGAPRYLTYSLNPDRRRVYESETNNGRCRVISPDFRANLVDRGPFDLTLPIKDDVRGVLLFSDGLQTFRRAEQGLPQVEVFDVLGQVLALKNLKGEYLKRRCKKFLHKFCPAQGWQHDDDFSVAGIMR